MVWDREQVNLLGRIYFKMGWTEQVSLRKWYLRWETLNWSRVLELRRKLKYDTFSHSDWERLKNLKITKCWWWCEKKKALRASISKDKYSRERFGIISQMWRQFCIYTPIMYPLILRCHRKFSITTWTVSKDGVSHIL